MEEEEEAPELISPRISFSHDLVVVAIATPPFVSRSSRLPAEPEFDFANAVAAADVAPADRLFAGGKLLPMPPLPLPPPAPKPTSPCKPLQACSTSSRVVRAQQQQHQAACQQQIRRPGSWAAPFSRSSSVNSATTAATTTTTGAPRPAGRFGCPPFPLMRSCSVGSAAAVGPRDRGAVVSDAAGGHRPHHHHHQYYKKFGGAAAATGKGGAGGSRAYYYGGSRKGSSHGVRVRPVLNVPFIGTSVSNVLSYLLCDCSHRTKKSREF